MPLLSITNNRAYDIAVTDPKKSFVPFTVPASGVVTNRKVLGVDLERMGPVLSALVLAGDITYTTAQDPGVDDAAENLMGPAAIADGAVTTAKLAAKAVTLAKAAVFISAELTGTGSAQNVAHGLGVVPTAVLYCQTAGHDGAGAAGSQFADVVEGSHTSTNAIVTVEAGAKFKLLVIV